MKNRLHTMIDETKNSNITLRVAQESELVKFKTDLQDAFMISAEKESGEKFDEPIPSDTDIDDSISSVGSIVYQILLNDKIVGGAIVSIDEITQHNKLLFFYINTNSHSKGIGFGAWKAIEKKHPETKVWETVTPYFEKRNIHFYVNKCGFKIVNFYNKYHPDPNRKVENNFDEDDEMFKFEKQM